MLRWPVLRARPSRALSVLARPQQPALPSPVLAPPQPPALPTQASPVPVLGLQESCLQAPRLPAWAGSVLHAPARPVPEPKADLRGARSAEPQAELRRAELRKAG